ncbi:hypothetical protein [Streptosporangium sp. NPDC051022]|uniref:hypothetical protein n=1 Tax=Streptosporangium sp. NPDC051022 TaxID=3155752 RepID=UPI003413CEC4
MPQPALLAHDLVHTLGDRRVLDGHGDEKGAEGPSAVGLSALPPPREHRGR